MPHSASDALSPLCDLALLTSLYASVLALVETSPRRLIAWLSLSQSCFILAGLESGSEAGVAGSLVYWVVVAVSTTALVLVFRFLEVRHAAPISLRSYHGFSAHAPRLAAFFVVPALALVGLPATLGFPAEDLLLHGALQSHPQLGIILPVATALNAITLFRFFARLFLGRHPHHTPAVPDALPRERFALAAAAVFLVAAGLYPSPVVGAFSKASPVTASVVPPLP
jgi:NADH-quinone oxidoreductase subunit M